MIPDPTIINSMARTLFVLSYTDWCDTWDEANDPERRPADAISARSGEDWFDVAPDGYVSEDCARLAAVLYGRIWQAWGADPWLVLYWNDHTGDTAAGRRALHDWGHYAIMSLLGHGVCFEDVHDTLRGPPSDPDREYEVPCLNIDVPVWPGRWPGDDEGGAK